MTPAQRAKLQAACDLVAKRKRDGAAPMSVIGELMRDHGASYDRRLDANRLRVAGVASSCTWSKDSGLLDNWTKTATLRLMAVNAEAPERAQRSNAYFAERKA